MQSKAQRTQFLHKVPDGHCDSLTTFYHQFLEREKYCMLLAGMWSKMTHKSSFISFVVLAEKDELLFSISFTCLSVCYPCP